MVYMFFSNVLAHSVFLLRILFSKLWIFFAIFLRAFSCHTGPADSSMVSRCPHENFDSDFQATTFFFSIRRYHINIMSSSSSTLSSFSSSLAFSSTSLYHRCPHHHYIIITTTTKVIIDVLGFALYRSVIFSVFTEQCVWSSFILVHGSRAPLRQPKSDSLRPINNSVTSSVIPLAFEP